MRVRYAHLRGRKMRQVQWRRFTFFDKETTTEDIASELGAEVSCMHTAGGRLYLGAFGGLRWIKRLIFDGYSSSRSTAVKDRIRSPASSRF